MTGLNRKELETTLYFLAAFSLFFGTRLFHAELTAYYNDEYYLILHTLFEMFSMFVSFSIFFYGWLTFPYTQSQQKLILSLIFLSVGVLDLFHTLTYKGMPFFQHNHQTTSIATWYWITARFTECIGLAIIFIKERERSISIYRKNMLFILAIIYNIILVSLILMHAEKLPILVIDGQGVTPIKITFEYIISFIHLITIVFIYKRYREGKDVNYLTVMVGIVFLFFGELIFTLYLHVYDIDNLLGHIFKAIGYFYLLKGVFFPQLEEVYTEREEVQSQWKKAEQKLKEQEQKFTTAIIQTQEDERKRVSRELHDGVGQAMYSILMGLRIIKRTTKEEPVLEQIEALENLTSSSMKEIKNIAYQLRPSALDDLGLIPALRSHIGRFEQTFPIKVNFITEGAVQRFSAEIETALYRIFQEALNNAAKYANTPAIDVTLSIKQEKLTLIIQDYGEGFDLQEYIQKETKGLGLFGMQERVSLLSGNVVISSEPGQGTTIHIEIPLLSESV